MLYYEHWLQEMRLVVVTQPYFESLVTEMAVHMELLVVLALMREVVIAPVTASVPLPVPVIVDTSVVILHCLYPNLR
jgi:hypothetical protein